MRLLLLNPNTSESVTDLLLAAAQKAAGPQTRLVPVTAPHGFPYISGRAEAQIAGATVLETLAAQQGQADAAIIAAFGDPGLEAARELFDMPVVGMSEAAMLTACMVGARFGIVTFAGSLGSWYRDCVARLGMADRCAGIRSGERPFTSLAGVQIEQRELLVELALKSVTEDGADVVILSGAPLAGLAALVADRIPVPVIDPVAAAVRQAETLVALGLRKPLAGTWRRPDAKPSTGLPPVLARHFLHEETATAVAAGTAIPATGDRP